MKVATSQANPARTTISVMALALALLALAQGDAAAQSVTRVTAGAWQATDFRDAVNPECSIGGPGPVPGSRLFMVASMQGPDPMNLVIRKPGWTIPPGATVDVLARFSNGSAMRLSGKGTGNMIDILLDAALLAPWVRGLTASSEMQLSFGGSEPSWTFDLTGTSKAINAMGDCFQAQRITGVAAPFTPAVAAADARPDTTQPFVGSPPPPMAAPAPVFTPPPPPPQAVAPAAPAYYPPPVTQGPWMAQVAAGDTVLMTWSGTGRMQTRPFRVDGPWELQWTRVSGHFSAVLHPADGAEGRTQLLANGSEASSSTSYQPKGGTFYFEFNSSNAWTARMVAVPEVGPASVPLAERGYPPSPLVPVVSASSPPLDPKTPPADQTALIAAVDAARQQYRDGANEMAKGASRPSRAVAICRALRSPSVQGWLGRIKTLSTNGDGKGVISIEVARDVYLKTWNNSLSDISDRTLIDPASAMFRTASGLSSGQAVRFSATLFPSDADCYREASLTMDGSITSPEFIMRLTAIEAVP